MLRYIHKDIVCEIYKTLHELKIKDIIDEYNKKWKPLFDVSHRFTINGFAICQFRWFGQLRMHYYYKINKFYPRNYNNMERTLYPLEIPLRYEYTCIKSDFIEC